MAGRARIVSLDWHRPALPSAVEWIVADLGTGGRLDLGDWLVVLPTGRSRRRLLQLLARHCQTQQIEFHRGRFLTVGQLAEELCENRLPFADDLESRMAWAEAMGELPQAALRQLMPESETGNFQSKFELAGTLKALHQRLGADTRSFASVAREVRSWRDFADGPRWEALADLQDRYYTRLKASGKWDQQAARNVAAKGIQEQCRTEKSILLVGTVDLNQMLRDMLEQVADHVTALVLCDDSTKAGFDALGCLLPGYWLKRELHLREELIRIVDRPLDQAHAVRQFIADLPAGLATDELSVCAPDESVAVLVQRLLSMEGLATRRLDGNSLAQSRVGRLIETVLSWIRGEDFDALAALVRHPDLQDWLSDQLPPGQTPQGIGSQWLDELDRFQNQFLPGQLKLRLSPENSSAPVFEGFPAVTRLMELMARLLGPLSPESQTTSTAKRGKRKDVRKERSENQTSSPDLVTAWAALLAAIYGERTLDLSCRADQATADGLAAIQQTLEQLSRLDGDSRRSLDGTVVGRCLLEALQNRSLPDDADPAAIELVGWLDLPLDDAQALIVAGFNDHNFPSSSQGHWLLPESLCRRLGLQDIERRQARDAWILAVACRARTKVGLIAGRRDRQDSPLLPSRLMFAEPEDVVVKRAGNFFGYRGSPHQRRWMVDSHPAATSQQLVIPRPVRVPPIERISVTRLRDYLKCPYRFYLSAILGLEQVSDTARELDGGAFGSLAHDVLEAFGNSSVANSADSEVISDFLRETLHELKRAALPMATLPAADIQVANLERRLQRFAGIQALRRQAGWEIVRVEPKVEWRISVNDQPFTLVGKIDRVDRHENGQLAVWDYKTSDAGKTAEQSHRLNGEWIDFQLPLYRHLLTRVLPDAQDQIDNIRLGYVLMPRDLKEIRFDEPEWSPVELRSADEQAWEVLRRIQAQIFWPPADDAPLFSDELAAICQDQVFERWQESGVHESGGSAPTG